MANKKQRLASSKTGRVPKTATSKVQLQSRPTKTTMSSDKPRRIRPAKGHFWQLAKPIDPLPKLPSVWWLTKRSASFLWTYRHLFIGIVVVYGLLNLVLVKGLASNTDVKSLKQTFDQAFKGDFGSILSGLGVFASLVGSAGNGSSQTAGAYQLFLALVVSLAVIWALRQTMAGVSLRIRDPYYQGMYPLIPFILVLLIIGLQLLPLLIGSALYATVINNGIATIFIEKLLFGLIFLVLALWSLYMLSASIFGLYIVTLANMTPRKALRSARELVRFRRWTVLRKIICLPILLLIVAAIIMLPIIIFITPAAQWIFFILTMFALPIVHTYMYSLYRELLNE